MTAIFGDYKRRGNTVSKFNLKDVNKLKLNEWKRSYYEKKIEADENSED